MAAHDDERLKLTATFLNNLAVAIATAGCVAPLFSVLYGLVHLDDDQKKWLLLAAPVWFVIGGLLHLVARLVLNGVGR